MLKDMLPFSGLLGSCVRMSTFLHMMPSRTTLGSLQKTWHMPCHSGACPSQGFANGFGSRLRDTVIFAEATSPGATTTEARVTKLSSRGAPFLGLLSYRISMTSEVGMESYLCLQDQLLQLQQHHILKASRHLHRKPWSMLKPSVLAMDRQRSSSCNNVQTALQIHVL